MNLSNELISYIGALIGEDVRRTAGTNRHVDSRAMRLQWVQAIESAYREAEQRERDMETMPSYRRIQAG